jgi:predicted nucleic acid-binding protein
MIFDTDVLIWVLRGNPKAAKAVEDAEDREISVVTYMELLQGARGRAEVKAIQGFLADFEFRTLPLTENVGHRASIYMEEYGLSGGIVMADALLAATAVEARQPLLTGNDRHYRPIRELTLKSFRP